MTAGVRGCVANPAVPVGGLGCFGLGSFVSGTLTDLDFCGRMGSVVVVALLFVVATKAVAGGLVGLAAGAVGTAAAIADDDGDDDDEEDDAGARGAGEGAAAGGVHGDVATTGTNKGGDAAVDALEPAALAVAAASAA